MRRVRDLIRRVPVGPVAIALVMVGVLVLVNLYGSKGAQDRAAPSQPVGIPPQLPAEEHPVPSTPAATEPPAATPPSGVETSMPAPGAPRGNPVPSTPRPTAAATAGAAPPAAPLPTATTKKDAGAQGVQGESTGGQGGSGSSGRFKVVEVVLSSDHGPGSYVRCNDREEVVLAATIKVDGGEGDIVYQWFFEQTKSWPPDQLHFTGTGKRQQSLTIPYKIPLKYSGYRIKGTVQLRILQPAVNAQTQKITIDVICA
ncbi:hypothetical protein [Yinghuangia soli]|uniref:Uncharacterized protein n=1 Tax=Yinghuangia soli TaxID=2908204 RepID=A0AA41U1T6_9ACTN|nr:hypothetical protein [Yinghuangia soli]MCF2526439.1 hypothetical protein [Yinghuangia soli]